MQKKYTYFILIFVAAILLLPFAQTALALEVSYPSLPFGNITPNSNLPSLPQYIAYFFYFFISVSGIIGVVAIVIGGFEFLISAGNESLISEARDRIRSAVFGIILLMCTFILIKTINPELLNLRMSAQTGTYNITTGVYVVLTGVAQPDDAGWRVSQNNHNTFGIKYAQAHDEDNDDGDPDDEWEDDADFTDIDDMDGDGVDDDGVATLYYEAEKMNYNTSRDHIPDSSNANLSFECDETQEENDDIVTVQIYYKDDFEEDSSTETREMECGDKISLAKVLSWKWKIREPGIYFYSEPGCSGVGNRYLGDSSYNAITSSQDIPDDFLDLKSFKIINDPGSETYWGLVMNAASDFKGECSQPAINITKKEICVEVSLTNFTPKSASVFHWNWKYDSNKYQNGVTLHGMPVEIETPPTGTNDAAVGAACYANSDCASGLTCGCLGGAPCGAPDGPAGICEPRSGDQDYYYIGAGKVQNHWYYVQEGYADHKAGYFTQAYRNISGIEIKDKINANGKGYYTCFNDPGVLLEEHEEGVDPCEGSSSSSNVCGLDAPLPSASQKNCLVPNSPSCIQSVISRDKYLYMLYAQNENGDNRTCSIFTEDIVDMQKIDFMENGKELYRLNIIPVIQ